MAGVQIQYEKYICVVSINRIMYQLIIYYRMIFLDLTIVQANFIQLTRIHNNFLEIRIHNNFLEIRIHNVACLLKIFILYYKHYLLLQ